MMDDFYAYVIISAHGNGNYGDEKDHSAVWGTIPKIVQEALSITDDDEEQTKWVGVLDQEQWEEFRDNWFIEPNDCEDTMGMVTEYGHMWALSYTSDGMDWNMGGVTHVDYVNVYFCCQDDDMMELVQA